LDFVTYSPHCSGFVTSARTITYPFGMGWNSSTRFYQPALAPAVRASRMWLIKVSAAILGSSACVIGRPMTM
jgi:hypothetical protein